MPLVEPGIVKSGMRLLVKCPSCGQKYDATKRKVGSRFRCHCGEVVEVAEPKAHEASVIHCAGCGGSRERGERACTYCGTDFTIHELDLNTVCPGCLARVSDRARYCHHCATPLSVEAVSGEETDYRCPACDDRQLISRRLEAISTTALECQVCAGLWIGIECFHDLLTLETRGAGGASVSHRRPSEAMGAGQSAARRYRPCAVCRELMVPRNIGNGRSGIILDVCGEHGLWFDCDELSHTIAWIRSGGLESLQDDVARLKGSPAAVRRKALAAKDSPKPRPATDSASCGGGFFDGNGDPFRRDSDDILSDLAIPLAFAAGRVVMAFFRK